MGSFNVSCGISGLSINEGDRVGYLILRKPHSAIKNTIQTNGKGDSNYLYCDALFSPFLPPVYGTYNDYGGVEDLDENITSKFLEKRYGIPIKDIIESISVSREIYYDDAPIYKNFIANEHKNSNSQWRTPIGEELEVLGFTKINQNEYKFKDKSIYLDSSSSSTNYEFREYVGTSSTSTPFIMNGKAYSGYATSWYALAHNFALVTGYLPGIPEELWKNVWELYSFSGMYFLPGAYDAVYEIIKDEYFEKKERERFNKEWSDFIEQLLDPPIKIGFSSSFNYGGEIIQQGTSFPINDKKDLTVYSGETGIAEMRTLRSLNSVMTSVNRMFFPSFNGEQNGNNEASLALAGFNSSFVKSRMKEYEDDEYDEYADSEEEK